MQNGTLVNGLKIHWHNQYTRPIHNSWGSLKTSLIHNILEFILRQCIKTWNGSGYCIMIIGKLASKDTFQQRQCTHVGDPQSTQTILSSVSTTKVRQ